MRIRILVWILFSAAMAACAGSAVADNGVYGGSGGSFSTGTAVGQTISVQGMPLSIPNATASFSCPITFYGAGIYELRWTCTGGSISIASTDNSIALSGTFSSGSMTFSGSGGGKGGHTSYWYVFSGTFTGTVTQSGTTEAIVGSISTSVHTTSQLGSGTAGLNSFSMGWSSAYAPIMVGDAANARLLGADDLSGANLVAYGSWGNAAGQFNAIAGLARDASGRIYVTDSTLNRLARIDDLTGRNWVELGGTGPGDLQFNGPRGVAIDAQGKVWVADAGNNRIVRFDDMTGANWTAFGASGSGANQFSAPAAVAFDAQGRIYVADSGNNRLVRFDDLTGTNWTALSIINIDPYGYELTAVNSVAVLANGKIYATTPSGWLYRVDDMTGANGEAGWWQPSITGISVDSAGTIFLAGGFAPGLAQTVDALGTGSFSGALGLTGLQPSAILSTATATLPPAVPVISSTTLAFGKRNVGEPGAPQSLAIANIGGQPLTVSSVSAGPEFPVTNGCTSPLTAGATCAIGIRFDPAAIGARSATLEIESNGAHSLLEAALNGIGTAPKVGLFPSALAFGPQLLNSSSGVELLTLTNPGTGPLTIASVSASGDFSQTNNCPAVLPVNGGCTISVAFTPSAGGVRTGSVVIVDDAVATGTQQTVALAGRGSASAPALALAPETLLFPAQHTKIPSNPQTVSLRNNSSKAVGIGKPSFPAGFAGSTSCGKTLAAGARCLIEVEFAPTAAGELSGRLSIPITGRPALSVGLAGTAVSGSQYPKLQPNPLSVDFGAVSLGDSSSQSISIKNASGLPVGVRSIILKGSAQFVRTGDNCPAILAGGASCTVSITLTPSASLSVYSATLSITESSSAVTRIAVSGTAESNGGN